MMTSLALSARLVLGFLILTATLSPSRGASLLDAFKASVGSLFTEQEEPPYDLIKAGLDYEERTYGSSKWVCTSETDIKKSTTRHQQETFLKLFSYIEGNNSDGTKIAMTIPVSIEYNHPNLKGTPTLSACFYLGKLYHTAEPPAPKDTTLSIVSREPITIFTREISGFLTSPKEWLTEAKELIGLVAKNGEKVRKDLMFWNAFDSPAQLFNRRNEVWLVKEGGAKQ